MGIELRSYKSTPLSFESLDDNFTFLKKPRWSLGDYSAGEFVIYQEPGNQLELYKCITTHNKSAYDLNNGSFSVVNGDIVLWSLVSSSANQQFFNSSGTAGSSGSSGSSGISALSGLSGTYGSSGLFGSSGTSGTNGTSKTSGSSGLGGQHGSAGRTPNTLWLSSGNTFGYIMTGGTLDDYDVNIGRYVPGIVNGADRRPSMALTNNHRGTIKLDGMLLDYAQADMTRPTGMTSPGISFSVTGGTSRGFIIDGYDGQGVTAWDKMGMGLLNLNNNIIIRSVSNHVTFSSQSNIYGFDRLSYIRTSSSTSGALRYLNYTNNNVTGSSVYVLAKWCGSNGVINPTGGTADWTLNKFNMTINEAGSPTGRKRSILIEPTLTSLLSRIKSIKDVTDHALAYSYYQTGSLTKNYFRGKVLIGDSGVTGSDSIVQITGNLELTTAGNKLMVKGKAVVDTGTTVNQSMVGQIYLVTGSGQVLKAMRADDCIFLTRSDYKTTSPGMYNSDLSATIDGSLTYFTITSEDPTESSLVNYLIINKI